MLLALDNRGYVTSVNKKGCEILEYDEDEIIGKNWFDNFIPERLRQKVTKVFHEIMNGNIYKFQHIYDHAVISKSGIEKDIAWHNSLLLDENGGILGTLSSGEDVTEQRKAEIDLRQSEEKFSKAFSASPEMIIISNLKDGTYIDVNDSFINATGYKREELIGHTVEEFHIWTSPEDQEKMVGLIEKQGYIRNEEFNFRMRSGEIRTWLYSAELLI